MNDKETKARVCRNCGAELSESAAFCTNCGAPAPVEKEKPVATGVIDPFDGTPAPTTASVSDGAPRKCAKCGADIAPGAAFCTVCGESASGAAAAEVAYCKKCGAKIEGMPEFCKNCGKPTADGVDKDNKRAKKRTISLIAYLVGAGLAAIVGFIFLCTPFMKISMVGIEITKQSGLGVIGLMFGGASGLAAYGASATTMRWAGWFYLVFLLAIVEVIVCIAINFKNFKKGDKPVGTVTSIALMLIASIGILVVSLVAKKGVNDSLMRSLSSAGAGMGSMYASMVDYYLGGVGVFVVTLIGFALCVFAVAFSYGTYEKTKQKLVGNRRIFLITDIVVAVIMIAFAIITALNPFGNKEYTVRPGDSGTAKIKCRDEISAMGETMYFGVVRFKLEDLEEGENYTFTVDTDFGLSASQMEGCMFLCYYDDIAEADTMKIYEIIGNEDFLATNQVAHADHAELSFTYDDFYIDNDLAIIVGFSATGKVTDEFQYSFN